MISKLPNIGESIFSTMTAMANAYGAINLSQGFPEFEPDEFLKEKLAFYVANGKNQYAPSNGIVELRELLGKKYKASAESEITITSGASEALFDALAAIVSPGDKVLVIEPAYDLYTPTIKLFAGIPVFVKMHFPDFNIDWQEVNDKIDAKTKAIIINNPHNPTGKMLHAADINSLENIFARHSHLFLIADEVYEHIVFENNAFISLCDSPILRERTLVCSSFAKTLHITGWKVGYCIAPPHLTKELRKIHQFNTFCTFSAAQYALADFLKKKQDFKELSLFYQKKRDLFTKVLSGSSLEVIPSQATFFQNIYYGDVTEKDDVTFAKLLVEKVGVAAIPTSAFYSDSTDNKVLRFCFAKNDDTLIQAAERLGEVSRYL